MKKLVIIPTYNEVDNIESLLLLLSKEIPQINGGFDVLFVDDGSPDGTVDKIHEMKRKIKTPGIYILERNEKQGLASAYLAGFTFGRDNGYDVMLEMDADLSHDPTYLPTMFKNSEENDFVIGSRYVKNGGVVGWGAIRKIISTGGSLFARLVLMCPIRDLTGGFNAWSVKALEAIGIKNIISKGYSFQIEMKYRAYTAGCTYKEVPILFKDREKGISKMSGAIFIEALINVFRLRKIVK